MGARLLAVRPTFAEQVTGRVRQAQPVYPKDLGAILVAADIHPGAKVVEAGQGNRGLAMAPLRPAGPRGRVAHYKLPEEVLEAAQKANPQTLGAPPPHLPPKRG